MSLSPVARTLMLDLPAAYCEVTMMVYTCISCSPSDHIRDLSTRLILVSLQKLQVFQGPQTAESIVTQPLHTVKTNIFSKDRDGSYDNARAKLAYEVEIGLAGMAQSLPKTALSQIRESLRDFLRYAVISHNRCGLWVSVTLNFVSIIPYDEKIEAHRNLMSQAAKTRSAPKEKICSCCASRCTYQDCVRMPWGDYCHVGCIWSWPRVEP